MTLLPEVREQLLDTAFGPSEPDVSKNRRLVSARRAAFAVPVVVALAVAAVLLVSLHGSASPGSPRTSSAAPSPSHPPQSWVNALAKARQQVGEKDRICTNQPTPTVRGQRMLTTSPPRPITALLPSLAAPAPPRQRVTSDQLRALNIEASDIYVRYAWQGHRDGVHFYVIPAGIVGRTRLPPARCEREQIAVFRRLAQQFPVGQRGAALTFAKQRLTPHSFAGVVVVTLASGDHSVDYQPASQLGQLSAHPAGFQGSSGSNNSTVTTSLVSDGVASVTATYPRSSHPGRVAKTMSITERPFRNLVVFHLRGAFDPPRLTFRLTDQPAMPTTAPRRPPAPDDPDVLLGDGIATTRFGQDSTNVRKVVDQLLSTSAGNEAAQRGMCDIDHTISWPRAEMRSTSPALTAFFRGGRFVGYQYTGAGRGPSTGKNANLHHSGLATGRGLSIGDSLARGRTLYGRAFKISTAQGGSWSVNTRTGGIAGYASNVPGRAPARAVLVSTIDAGDVGCPAQAP